MYALVIEQFGTEDGPFIVYFPIQSVVHLSIVSKLFVCLPEGTTYYSIDWFTGKNTGKSHISWKNLWFPVNFPLSQPSELYH